MTSLELTQLYLDRLERHDPELQCVVTLTKERALEQARRADAELGAGKPRGPLHGIPWGAKDLLAVPDYPATWGSPIYREQVLAETASVVERLDAAGAVLVAKLSLGELALGDVWFGGTTKNPWNPAQGSIVSPATRCGVTGLRPTFGRVSRAGAMALCWSMDKLGPMGRSAEDCALVFQAIHGPDGKDPTAVDRPFAWRPERGLARLKIGYVKAAFETERPNRTFDDEALKVMQGLGVSLIPVELPADPPVAALRIILSAEAAAAFDEVTRSNRDDLMVRQVRGAWPNSFRTARFIPAVEYIQANRARTLLMQRMDAVMQAVDLFVTPSFGGNVLLITSLTGHPALVMPNGLTAEAAPVSLSFIGRLFGEADLLAVGQAYQETTGFHRKRPPKFT